MNIRWTIVLCLLAVPRLASADTPAPAGEHQLAVTSEVQLVRRFPTLLYGGLRYEYWGVSGHGLVVGVAYGEEIDAEPGDEVPVVGLSAEVGWLFQLVRRDVFRLYGVAQFGGVLTGGGAGTTMRAGAGLEVRLGSTLVLASELTGGFLAGKAGLLGLRLQLGARW